mgnify:CR=1 FL=1
MYAMSPETSLAEEAIIIFGLILINKYNAIIKYIIPAKVFFNSFS